MRRDLGTCFALLIFLACCSGTAQAARVFALPTDATPRVISFDASAPGTLLSSVDVSGAGPGETLVGIDRRPANAAIYAITAQGSTRFLRTLDPATGALGAPLPLTADPVDATSPYSTFNTAQ